MAKFADILNAIRLELVRLNVVQDINRVILCARRNVPKLTGDKDIVLRVNGTQVLTSVEGEGRFYTKLRRIIEVIPRCRLAQDEAGKDNGWLTDEALGFLTLEESVFDALQLFQPTNTDTSEFLTIEPMRWVSSGNPDKDPSPDGTWGSETMLLEIVYQAVLEQDRQ